MAADLVTIIETVAVTQFLTPASKNLGEVVLERGKQMASKAVAYLAAVGRSPQSVEEKLLVPIALGAGLESDSALADLWAALLANAADPAQRTQVQPGFADVLRQLTTTDARVLQYIYQNVNLVTDSDESRPSINGDKVGTYTASMQEELGLDTFTMQGVIDNLLRLRVGKWPEGGLGGGLLLYNTFSPVGRVLPTVFGYQLMKAVTPPTP